MKLEEVRMELDVIAAARANIRIVGSDEASDFLLIGELMERIENEDPEGEKILSLIDITKKLVGCYVRIN